MNSEKVKNIVDVMDEYSLILRRRANIEHIGLGEQRVDTATRDAR